MTAILHSHTESPTPEMIPRLPTPPTPPPDLCLAGTAPMEPKDLLKPKKPKRKRRRKAEIEAQQELMRSTSLHAEGKQVQMSCLLTYPHIGGLGS